MRGRARLNALLAVAVVAVFGLDFALRPDPARRNFEVMPEMVDSVPYDSFSPNPVLAGGTTLQPPPQGTVPRGRMPLRYAATPEDNLRAGAELSNPFSAEDPAALERGSRVFGIYCRLCHGPGGEGDGPVARRGFPAPPSLLAPDALALADGQIFHIITFGRGNMPGHAVQVEPEDRWKAALWVRRLQREAGAAETGQAEAAGAAAATGGADEGPLPEGATGPGAAAARAAPVTAAGAGAGEGAAGPPPSGEGAP